MEIEHTLFTRLPDDIIYKICIYTGKFILRYDNKLKKTILVSIIDFNDKLWVTFNKMVLECFLKKMRNPFGRNVNCSISRSGDLCTRVYLRAIPISLIDIMNDDNNNNNNDYNNDEDDYDDEYDDEYDDSEDTGEISEEIISQDDV